ncbi:hypothetical protein COCCADRAFT_110835, partial [Bipolaris zeicola 26-R-13]
QPKTLPLYKIGWYIFSLFPILYAMDPIVNRRLEKTIVSGSKATPEHTRLEKERKARSPNVVADEDALQKQTPSATLDWRATSE